MQSPSRRKNHRQKILGLHSENEGTQKVEEETLSERNAVGKMQQKAQYAIYRAITPWKTKRSATPSLKRHAAWEYTETAAHHKCSPLSLRPLATWPNERKK